MLELINEAATWVLTAPPDPGGGAPPPGSGGVLEILKWAAWLASAACVLGVIVTGTAMALSLRTHGAGSEHAVRLGWVFGGIIVIGSASAFVSTILGRAG